MIFHGLEFATLFILLLILLSLSFNQIFKKLIIILTSFIFLGYGDLKSLLIFFIISISTYFSINTIDTKAESNLPNVAILLIIMSIFGAKFFITSTFYLPIGISFYGLQAISVIIDRKTNKYNETISFIDLILYLCFFPQLIAGPICRAHQLLPQLKKEILLKKENILEGSNEILEGLFLKLILAGYLGPKVMHFINNPQIMSGPLYWLLIIISYSCYIYTDFNSYSKMAIGLSKMIGIEIPHNFNFPYFKRNLKEFWRDWHITLSNWLRDYIYVPMGGKNNFLLATFITFMISSIWHGFGLNFIIWGLIHFIGLMLTTHRIDLFSKILNYLVMHVCILLGWVFFASKDIQTALSIVKNFFGPHTQIQISSLSDLFIFSSLTYLTDYLFKSKFYTSALDPKFGYPFLIAKRYSAGLFMPRAEWGAI